MAAMNARLASGDPGAVNDPAFYEAYEQMKQTLETLMQQWEQAHSELEAFKSDYMNSDESI
jgi:hypothetical protein